MRTERKSDKYTLASGDNFIELQDITNYSGISVQVKGPGAGAGSLDLEVSNDGANWFPTSTAASTIASGLAFHQDTLIMAARVRAKINLSAGPGEYEISSLAKEY